MKASLASEDVTLLDEHGVGVIVIFHGDSVNEVPKAGANRKSSKLWGELILK